MTIGTATAFVSYRQCFASVWDFRFNHILLSKRTSLFIRHPAGGNFARFPYSLDSTTPDLANESSGSHGGLLNNEKHDQQSTVGRGYDAPFSREGGWGHGVGDSGAPGDALRSGERAFGGVGGVGRGNAFGNGGVGSGLTNGGGFGSDLTQGGGGNGLGHHHHGLGGEARQEELEVQRGAGAV